jgi:LacI family transcriptional regulator
MNAKPKKLGRSANKVANAPVKKAVGEARTSRQVTIKDIASMSGVHRATASKVLNGVGDIKISSATRKRILNAAQELGFSIENAFHPPEEAKCFGLIEASRYDKQANPFYSDVFDGIRSESRASGLNIFLINDFKRLDVMRLLSQENFLGMLAVGGVAMEQVASFELAGKPLVDIEAPHPHTSSSLYSVRTDSQKAMFEATCRLIEMGHKHIYYLSFLQKNGKEPHVSLDRFAGVAMAMQKAGLYHDEVRVATRASDEGSEFSSGRDLGYRAMQELLGRNPPKPFACVCYADLYAEGACQAAKDHGLTVPGDVSFVGHDNLPGSATMDPPLTTIDVPRVELGVQAVRMLLSIHRGEAEREIILPSRLIERQSVRTISG